MDLAVWLEQVEPSCKPRTTSHNNWMPLHARVDVDVDTAAILIDRRETT